MFFPISFSAHDSDIEFDVILVERLGHLKFHALGKSVELNFPKTNFEGLNSFLALSMDGFFERDFLSTMPYYPIEKIYLEVI